MAETKPDIAFATSVVIRFAENPSWPHIEDVKTIIRHLKATRTVSIIYCGEKEGELIVKSYSDSDWAGDHATRKSTSGFIFMLNGEAVSWCSKRQATVAMSSTNAEYVALILAAKKATWLRLLLTEIGLLNKEDQYAEIKVAQVSKEEEQIKADVEWQEEEELSMTLTSKIAPTALATLSPLTSNDSSLGVSLKEDNQGSIAFAHNPVFHAHTQHIDIQHH